jgi:aminoglycoside 2'-N-acetyltransferase I
MRSFRRNRVGTRSRERIDGSADETGRAHVRIVRTNDLSPQVIGKLRRLNEDAHGHPFVEDWDHALGGMHFFIEDEGEPVSHASVVERRLATGGRRLRTGYVEAVATRPDRQHRRLAGRVIQAVTDFVRAEFELGALCTGENDFYARFGWETWRGPTFVRTEDGLVRTSHEDGNVMILPTTLSPEIDLDAAISCEWRSGDVW